MKPWHWPMRVNSSDLHQKNESLLPPGEFFILKIPENSEGDFKNESTVLTESQLSDKTTEDPQDETNNKKNCSTTIHTENSADNVKSTEDTNAVEKSTVEKILERIQGSELVLAEDLVICGLCGKSFLDIKQFLQHKSTHKTYASKYRCELCRQTFCRHATLMDHYQRRHRTIVRVSPNLVTEPNEEEPSNEKRKRSNFKTMSRGVQVDIKAPSPGADLAFSGGDIGPQVNNLKHLEDSQLDFHFIISVETVKKNQFDYASVYLKCLHCRFKTTSRANLRTHMRAKHPDMIDINQRISIGENGTGNHRLVSMSEYKRQLHKQQSGQRIDKQDVLGQFPCPICNKVFGRLRYLRAHMPVHRKELSFMCEECGRHFKSRASVYAHKRRFHKGVMYKCPHCSFRTGVNILYHRHKRMHSVSRRGQICDVCGEAFIHSHQLKKHLSVHDPTKPYQCKIQSCSWRFDNENKLKNHLFIYHAEKETEAPASVVESDHQHMATDGLSLSDDSKVGQQNQQTNETKDNSSGNVPQQEDGSDPQPQITYVIQPEGSVPQLTRQNVVFTLNPKDAESSQRQAEGQFGQDGMNISYQQSGEVDILFSAMATSHSGTTDHSTDHATDQALMQGFNSLTSVGQQGGTSHPNSNVLMTIAQQYRNAQVLLEEGFTGEQVLRLLLENQSEGVLSLGQVQLPRHLQADPNADMVGQPRTSVPVSQLSAYSSLAVLPTVSSPPTSFSSNPIFLQQFLDQTHGAVGQGVLGEGQDLGVYSSGSLTQGQVQQFTTGGVGDGFQPMDTQQPEECFDPLLQHSQDAGETINTSNGT
ncbi:zinc finger and BTB domain-containing protein 41-like [Lingula anatina]|uniref:Zinc finger and BTB domain-containing protein 41-like n=1 Tax=Lingula anatina TaxID=7574 RepID=A0A1S3KGX4_LINAN|nr:zinc finger and BTB domain-containing protein 41-like [Lingula anatina]|eukprot:XP_013421895.1 zinc finger and BTB domain-containing protein 41-like [Lingula anatina]